VSEFKNLKHLSDGEMEELKAELKESWCEIEKVVKGKPKTPPTAPIVRK